MPRQPIVAPNDPQPSSQDGTTPADGGEPQATQPTPVAAAPTRQNSPQTQPQQQQDNNDNPPDNNPPPVSSLPSQAQAQAQDSTSSQDLATSTANNGGDTATQAQVVMDTGPSSSYYGPSEMSIPSHRTGLIRPTMSSTWQRPTQPAEALQPGIITASIFVLFSIAAAALYLVRRWRRNKTRRRTRSVINLLHRARFQQGRHDSPPDGDDDEKSIQPKSVDEIESGSPAFNKDHEGGSYFDTSFDDLAVPAPAKTRPPSRDMKEYDEDSVMNSHQGEVIASSNVKFSVPYAPARPSKLRD